MQWNSEADAGFSTTAKTWLAPVSDYKSVNVAREEQNKSSLLNYYKTLIQMRKRNTALRAGGFAFIDENNPSVLSFVRKATPFWCR
ncbi:MAG TPA: hypothetical protein VH325_11305 [Bryobacteraceae bacterium]|jgi:alpha-glucosidase|nr:hypothetical protein [Bryobacteraceae bacterium]